MGAECFWFCLPVYPQYLGYIWDTKYNLQFFLNEFCVFLLLKKISSSTLSSTGSLCVLLCVTSTFSEFISNSKIREFVLLALFCR